MSVPGLRRQWRGFTLVELLVTLAVAAVLAGVALPSFAEHWRQARRSDAVVALTRIQLAQEQHRAVHGLYAASFGALKGGASARSDQGWYELELLEVAGERYQAVAVARADGAQGGDLACARIVLAVNAGVADIGPDPRCWNR